ncbi:ribonuclease H [Rhizobium sp. 18055]|uniref:ribonuclease H family protein n=1 Tax=Rhizobium sp. 18055 TaxID=2681403 RepID=UPI001357075D|nr:ribonuclease H [Rhizobium sp. 18055]
MTETANDLRPADSAVGQSLLAPGLQVFTDGSYEPGSRRGGWAFVVYRDGVEIASDYGGVSDFPNNSMELIALIEAARWIGSHASGHDAVIWTDSQYAVNGCNCWRHIWKNNGWKKITANARLRSRTIANAELWMAIDRALSPNPLVTIAWCKGHVGIRGNERADALAEEGRIWVVND